MKPALLSQAQLDGALADLPDWRLHDARLRRTLRFADFAAAFRFMTDVAAVAEAQDHHPDWRNVYATVEIALSTHDAGGITQRDVRLALEIDRLAAAHNLRSRS